MGQKGVAIIIRFIAHHVQDGYTLVENTLMTIKNPWEKKVSQNKWDTETSTTRSQNTVSATLRDRLNGGNLEID